MKNKAFKLGDIVRCVATRKVGIVDAIGARLVLIKVGNEFFSVSRRTTFKA